jgi:hypothetical protein
MLPTKFRFIWPSGFRGDDLLKINQSETRIACSGTFWFKIKQFWPFEEISIFSNSGYLGWRARLSDITFKGNPQRMIQAKFGLNWPSGFRGEDF